jgi:hypothetical protein
VVRKARIIGQQEWPIYLKKLEDAVDALLSYLDGKGAV